LRELREETYRGEGQRTLGGEPDVRSRQLERQQPQYRFSPGPQRFAARRENVQSPSSSQQGFDCVYHRLQQMLAVVEPQGRTLLADEIEEVRYRIHESARSEIDEVHAAEAAGAVAMRRRDGDARLADPSGTDERHEAGVLQPTLEIRERILMTDQPRRRWNE